MGSFAKIVTIAGVAIAMAVLPLSAQGTGGSGSGSGSGSGGGEGGGSCGGENEQGGGCGELYGDLYVIARDVNGVPLAVHYVVEGVDHLAYQPLDIHGNPIPLGPEGQVIDEQALVAVEFGRCNSMRAPSKVSKMHFDKVIKAIQEADSVIRGVTGQLVLVTDGEATTLDSPVGNLALYKHLMKVGHLQTDPFALDDSHGSHAEIVYRPALREEDYAKFDRSLEHLLPNGGKHCWIEGALVPGMLQREPLSEDDLLGAAMLLAAAADKTARITVDAVEYLNAIMGIPGSQSLLDPIDPARSYVDFTDFKYFRAGTFDAAVQAMVPDGRGAWYEMSVDVLCWLDHVDPMRNRGAKVRNIAGFVQAANDALRTIEFIHNYAPPVTLWNKTVSDGPFRY